MEEYSLYSILFYQLRVHNAIAIVASDIPRDFKRHWVLAYRRKQMFFKEEHGPFGTFAAENARELRHVNSTAPQSKIERRETTSKTKRL